MYKIVVHCCENKKYLEGIDLKPTMSTFLCFETIKKFAVAHFNIISPRNILELVSCCLGFDTSLILTLVH